MTLTNEDLLAISQLLDVKLKAEIQPMKNEIQTLRSEMRELQANFHVLQSEVHELQAGFHSLQSEVHELQAGFHSLQSEVHELQAGFHSLQSEVHELQACFHALETEVHQIKLFQETVIMPRLNTIESCYTSTYNRYRDSVEGYEALQADNEIMKKVIMEHNEKLKKLA